MFRSSRCIFMNTTFWNWMILRKIAYDSTISSGEWGKEKPQMNKHRPYFEVRIDYDNYKLFWTCLGDIQKFWCLSWCLQIAKLEGLRLESNVVRSVFTLTLWKRNWFCVLNRDTVFQILKWIYMFIVWLGF